MASLGAASGDADADLVVIGAGVAGWTAARRAQDLGARVVVVEKAPEAPGWGNGRLSGGVFHAAYLSPARPPEELYEALMTAGSGHVRPELAWAWATNCSRAQQFLAAEGGRFERQSDEEWQWNALSPFQPVALGQHWRGNGADQLLTAMWQRFVGRDGTALFGSRALRLVGDKGCVAGVVVESGRCTETIRARAVLIADGGFQANREMVRTFITTVYRLRAADTGTGDGIRMAVEYGAQTVNMEAFYGHCMSRDALWDNQLWPMLSLYPIIAVSPVIGPDGRRFADEGVSNQHMAQAIARSPNPGANWVVFDNQVWEGEARGGPLPPNPVLSEQHARIVTADSVADLATQLGTDVSALNATIERFNAYAANGGATWPTRTAKALPVCSPPFYALPVIAGITFTMGGLLVDEHAMVQSTDGDGIQGLYAAGGAMGGLQGGPKPAYSGGWSEAATFGLLAAEHSTRCS